MNKEMKKEKTDYKTATKVVEYVNVDREDA